MTHLLNMIMLSRFELGIFYTLHETDIRFPSFQRKGNVIVMELQIVAIVKKHIFKEVIETVMENLKK